MSQRHTGGAPHDDALGPDELIDRLVAWHRAQRAGKRDVTAALEALRRRAHAEVKALEALLASDDDRRRLSSLARWLEESLQRLAPVLESRGEALLPRSWARDHARSRLMDQGRVLMVNAIDRDLEGPGAELPLDPGSDLASLLVGLEIREETVLARRVLDRYLRGSGDYRLARLLSVLRVLEALAGACRALRRHRAVDGDAQQSARLAEAVGACRRYLELAERYAEFRFPPLVVGVGVAGSGKSRFTRTLVGRLGAIRVCSDAERRRLHGLDPQAASLEPPVDIFTRDATERTYHRLAECAGMLLDAGLAVCVDGTCLKREQRDLLRHQAESRGLPVLLVSFEADDATLERRITKRAGRQGVTVEESLAVLARQQAAFEPFGDEERRHLVHLDTTADNAAETLAGLIQEHMRQP